MNDFILAHFSYSALDWLSIRFDERERDNYPVYVCVVWKKEFFLGIVLHLSLLASVRWYKLWLLGAAGQNKDLFLSVFCLRWIQDIETNRSDLSKNIKMSSRIPADKVRFHILLIELKLYHYKTIRLFFFCIDCNVIKTLVTFRLFTIFQ